MPFKGPPKNTIRLDSKVFQSTTYSYFSNSFFRHDSFAQLRCIHRLVLGSDLALIFKFQTTNKLKHKAGSWKNICLFNVNYYLKTYNQPSTKNCHYVLRKLREPGNRRAIYVFLKCIGIFERFISSLMCSDEREYIVKSSDWKIGEALCQIKGIKHKRCCQPQGKVFRFV